MRHFAPYADNLLDHTRTHDPRILKGPFRVGRGLISLGIYDFTPCLRRHTL